MFKFNPLTGVFDIVASASGGGVTTVGTYDSQGSAPDGLIIGGSTIYAQSASFSLPGMLNANQSGQSLLGRKSFTFPVSDSTPIVGLYTELDIGYGSPSTGGTQTGFESYISGNDGHDHSLDSIVATLSDIQWGSGNVGSMIGHRSYIQTGATPIAIGEMYGYKADLLNQSSSNTSNAITGLVNSIQDSTSAVTNALIGVQTSINFAGTGSVNNLYGEIITINQFSGTVNTASYGVCVFALPSSAAAYAFYDNTTFAKSIFNEVTIKGDGVNSHRLVFNSGNNADHISFRAPDNFAPSQNYLLPGALPSSANGYFLTSDNTGIMSWGIPPNILTIGTFDGFTASANGLAISSNQIFAQSATATLPGMINADLTTTQYMAGQKQWTFDPLQNTSATTATFVNSTAYTAPSIGGQQFIAVEALTVVSDNQDHSNDSAIGLSAQVNAASTSNLYGVYGVNSIVSTSSNPVAVTYLVGAFNEVSNNSASSVPNIYGTFNTIADNGLASGGTIAGTWNYLRTGGAGASYNRVYGNYVEMIHSGVGSLSMACAYYVSAIPSTASQQYAFFDATSNGQGIFNNLVIKGTGAAPHALYFNDASAGIGGNTISLQAPNSLAGSTPYILPPSYPSLGVGYFLTSSNSGTMGWALGSQGNPIAYIESRTTQNIASTTVAQAVAFEVTGFLNGFAHSNVTNNSRLTVLQAGTYVFSVHMQVGLTSGANQTMNYWWRVNGTDVAYSNNSFTIDNSGDQKQIAKTEPLQLNANDYVELMLSGQSTNLQIFTAAPAASPTRPGIPSAEIVAWMVSS